MKLLTNYQDSQGINFQIFANDSVQGVGALNDNYGLYFEIRYQDNGEGQGFSAYIEITDHFRLFQRMNSVNKTKDTHEILVELGLPVIEAHIEEGKRTDLRRQFRYQEETYEMIISSLKNNLYWKKAKLIEYNGKKFIVFNNTHHWIPDTETRELLGYPIDQFVPVSQKEFEVFKSGKNVNSVHTVKLIRNAKSPNNVYALFDFPVNEKRHIPNPETLSYAGRNLNEPVTYDESDFNVIPLGEALTSKNIPLENEIESTTYNVFIAHATEDKEYVRKIATSLQNRGLAIWYDEFQIKIGDNLSRRIEDGLGKSRYGVVVLSPNFFKKEWPQKELGALMQKERGGTKVILPILLNMTHADLVRISPMLADKVSLDTNEVDMANIIEQIAEVVEG